MKEHKRLDTKLKIYVANFLIFLIWKYDTLPSMFLHNFI